MLCALGAGDSGMNVTDLRKASLPPFVESHKESRLEKEAYLFRVSTKAKFVLPP
jgi:hypothetical protein